MFGLIFETSNKQKLFQYFSKACELNSGSGCYFLAPFYYDGEIVKKDLKKATQYYKKACKLGSEEACDLMIRAILGLD
ncbi:tetratricopeptide repeat protein [Helicobacter acinonychis]|uniref:tetratricopeptide repeat protein n=1 Tax=Helicobacter acinonychis TaxID=212 RepID=UPI001F1E11CB|nr:hypothetical protein [Helicobacter acinonychis]